MVLGRRPGSLNINLKSVTDVVTPLERTKEKCICGVSNLTKHRNMDTPSCCINRQRHTRKMHTATFTWSPSLLLSQVQVEHIQRWQFGWVSLSSMKRIRAERVCVDVRMCCSCWSGRRGGRGWWVGCRASIPSALSSVAARKLCQQGRAKLLRASAAPLIELKVDLRWIMSVELGLSSQSRFAYLNVRSIIKAQVCFPQVGHETPLKVSSVCNTLWCQKWPNKLHSVDWNMYRVHCLLINCIILINLHYLHDAVEQM